MVSLMLLVTLACSPVSSSQDSSDTTDGSPSRNLSSGTPAAPNAVEGREETADQQSSTTGQATRRPASTERHPAFLAKMEVRMTLVRGFREAETGRWRLRSYPHGEDFPSITLKADSGRADVVLTCITTDQQTDYRALDVSFERTGRDRHESSLISFRFRGDGDEDIRSFSHYIYPEEPEEPAPSRQRSFGVTYRMGEIAQQVVDGMLAPGVLEMVVEFNEGHYDRDNSIDSFLVTGIAAISKLLTTYCQLTASEATTAVAANVLKAPTVTPTPPPTPTPTPLVTFRQEWCRERDGRPFKKEGRWYGPGKGVSGSARLIMRCTGGTLVAGLHIIRSDGQYPENRTGVAIAALVNDRIKPYQYYPDGWQQLSGETGGGRFIVIPDEAVRKIIGLIDRERYGGAKTLGFWVLLDAVPDPQPGTKQYDQSLGPDVIMPIRSVFSSDYIHPGVPTAAPTPTSRPTPTPTAPPTPRPQPVSASLIAEFISVPASHNGRDAIRLRLQFTEPVATSYKVLRDTAVQVKNGTVEESKRVDGRSDLWRITVKPRGDGDVVIRLKTAGACDGAAAVCTESGKVMSNSPVVRVPHRP